VTLPVVWIPEANEDLLDARAWYDNIRPQLGERFALAVEATVEGQEPRAACVMIWKGMALAVPPDPPLLCHPERSIILRWRRMRPVEGSAVEIRMRVPQFVDRVVFRVRDLNQTKRFYTALLAHDPVQAEKALCIRRAIPGCSLRFVMQAG
jgi:hypothetical protein